MNKSIFNRYKCIFVIFILLFGILLEQLVRLQILDGKKLTVMADKMRMQIVVGTEYPRGDILDYKKRSLLDSQKKKTLIVFPAVVKKNDSLIRELSSILHISYGNIVNQIGLMQKNYGNRPFVLKSNLNIEEELKINNLKAKGIYIVPIEGRYGSHSLAVHLIGHVGQIDNNSWQKLKKHYASEDELNSYKKNTIIGVKGLEAIYDRYLRETEPDHYIAAAVDAKGNVLDGLGFRKIANVTTNKQKNNLVLTLDKDIQRIVEDVLDHQVKKGAVVILRISTGEVVAMASRPSFKQDAVFQYIQNDKVSAEFTNRSLEHYYPGSVFKIVIAAASLEEGLVKPNDFFNCVEKFVFANGETIPCWKKGGHGKISFSEAFAQSCNSTFIQLALRLGSDKIQDYANRFGLTEDYLIGYKNEQFQSINIPKNNDVAIGNASLGQQGIMLTPLQIAGIISTIANNGVMHKPRVANSIENNDHKIIKQWFTPKGQRVISKKTALLMQSLLKDTALTGTGKKAWISGWGSAGKTGSAQTGNYAANGKEILNTWFAGYAPLEKPEYAVTVLVENGTAGGVDAAPIFKKIMEQILALKYASPK
ncbi:penicillin-binding transpeptidase domain-containing protein [Bacillota bacterium LX-D]|nr:penicillin-binding transpeptidase domain-containing protein [Bacillota bacterium LX-D]